MAHFMLLLHDEPAALGRLSPEDAANHIGETATVCGAVASAKYEANAQSQPTLLDLGKAYPSAVFTAVTQVGPLLDQIDDPIASLTGDGAYDQDGVYREVAARHPDAAVIVPPRSSAVPSETAENAPTPRDRHLQAIAEHGRMGWQKASGYNWRALVEADIGRWKRVIGHALRSQTNERQAAEVAIAVDVLNAGAGTPELRPRIA